MRTLLAAIAAFATLTACTSTQDAGNDKLRAIEVPAEWSEGAWGSGGDFGLGSSYRMWTLEYAPTEQTGDQIRQIYDSALTNAGWTWHSTCTTKRLYSSEVKDGCWQLKDYMLIYRVESKVGDTKQYVDATMFKDD
ncbi:hypothetical protein [Actinoplanes sp. L3-i22]|uniref:hypothetical protein n=1 Tax=Actinoplanes sp. L3-i22 TaxID=2836373 RepID=UPI001C78602C|nr:hypothetical protein [Actinoplanes sp. L3-i22]BCY08867.1 hypothetical protein L3i22_039550 [Actinoplanes sp. L3-i22]